MSTPSNSPARKVTIVIAIVLLVGGFFLIRGITPDATSATAYHTIKKQEFLVTIVEGGTLDAVNELVVRNEVEGNARIIYLIPEGSFVKRGDLLVELETSEAEDKVNQQQLAYEKSQSLFVQAQNSLEIQRSTIQSEIDAAELVLEFSKIDLDKYNKGERLQTERNAEISITTARGDLLLAKETLDWSIRLEEKGFETKDAVAKGKNQVLDLTLKVEQAETNLWIIKTFDQPKQLRTYQSAVEEAAKDLERVKAQGLGKLAQLTADLITESNSLNLTFTKLTDDREQLSKSKIYAPADGLVVYAINRSRFSSQSMIEEGAQVRERQELIKLPDTSRMKVEIKVHESHINKVHVNQPAFVILDPLPDKPFRAQVSKVGVLPDTQSRFGNPDLKVYKTEVVILDTLPDEIKPGVSARAEIVITNIPNALTVPVQAVTSYKGQSVVFVRDGSKDTPIPVEVGLFNTKFIEITSGAEEGQEVLLSPPYDVNEKDLGGAIITGKDEIHNPEPLPDAKSSDRPSGNRKKRGDQEDGDRQGRSGRRSQDGQSGGRNREEMMKRFDKNGDGTIDESEREEARKQSGSGARSKGN